MLKKGKSPLLLHPGQQSCSFAQSCPTLCNPMRCSTPGLPVLHQLPEFAQTLMSIKLVMPSNHLVLCCPLLFLPSVFPIVRVFSSESVLRIRWPKYWSFSFSISPFSEHSRLISFTIDCFGILAVQGTLKSLLQYPGSKASVLRCSAFFIVQLSYPYTGKTIALTRQTFVGKVTSLLFKVLSRFVIAFFQGASILISWLQRPSAVILEPKKIKPVTISVVSPYICNEVMGPDAMILVL